MQHSLLDFNLNNQSAKPSYFVHLYKILHSTMQMLSLIDSFHTLPSYSHAKSNLCKTQALAKCCKFLCRTTLRWKVSRVYAMVGCPSVRLSVPSQLLLCIRRAGDIDRLLTSRRSLGSSGVTARQIRAVCVTFTGDVGSSTLTCRNSKWSNRQKLH